MPSEPDKNNATDISAAVFNLLTVKLGPFIARTSISMAAKRIGKTTDTLTIGDVSALSEALRPSLRTLVGKQNGDRLVTDIQVLAK